ncbi:MAG TPA: prepilin-type N-terminal cleavage/methylation domain-containing protein, partial [Candidatus Wujingus californicus]|uniref:prepilin-type N-terminal cleavage/methylation domain-containing protein n=1 Tax=Candidatus Wujingus californicus TaxID=3367618 RepID=UPI004026E776
MTRVFECLLGRNKISVSKRINGFTLIELIVVLLIIGIISGVVAVRYTGSLDSIRFRKTMTELVFFLRESRIKAMAAGEPVNVIFDLHGGFCWDNDRNVFKLYPEIEIFTDKIDVREEPTRTIVFYPG